MKDIAANQPIIEKPAAREAVITVRGLRTQFGPQIVHQYLDLDVWKGEVLGVVGG